MILRQAKGERGLCLRTDVRVRPRDIHTSPSLVSRIAPALVRPVVPRYRSTCLGVTDKVCYRKLHIPHRLRQHHKRTTGQWSVGDFFYSNSPRRMWSNRSLLIKSYRELTESSDILSARLKNCTRIKSPNYVGR